jgi:hypothetical protein
MSDAAKLADCPFCGSAAKYTFNAFLGSNSMAQCESCGAQAYWSKWNTRASLPREAELRRALEFGVWSFAGPTNDAEIKILEEHIEEAWQEYRAPLSSEGQEKKSQDEIDNCSCSPRYRPDCAYMKGGYCVDPSGPSEAPPLHEGERAPWFKLSGDARLGRCDTDDCGGQPTWRLEAGGVGSNYCSGCKEKIQSSDGGVETRRHATTGNMPGSVPGEELSSSATSFERATVTGASLESRAGVATGPSEALFPRGKQTYGLKTTLATMKSAKEKGVNMNIWDRDIEVVEEALAIIESLRSPPVSAAWQPIETAPKDGSPVLGFMPKYFRGKGGQSVILWLDMEWSDMGAHPCDPSHWMPLPAAPDTEGR